MKAHLFVDGGGIVTGTDDVTAARDLIRREWGTKVLHLDVSDPAQAAALDVGELSGLAQWDIEPSVEVGRIVPATGGDAAAGYRWWWRRGSGQVGQRGVTTAVVWP